MSAGTSVIVVTIVYFALVGVRFYLAWRFPAGDEGDEMPGDVTSYFGPFGHVGCGRNAGLYWPWEIGHWSVHPDDRDSHP